MKSPLPHLPEREKSPVDWRELHRRLEQTADTIERGLSPSEKAKKDILRARARTLAQDSRNKITAEPSLEIVEFRLAQETYGVESSFVREIYPLKVFTPVPGTPLFVLGIVNVRGQLVSVINLKQFFGLPEQGLTDLNKVVILRNETMEFGILADLVLGVRHVLVRELQPALPTLTDIRAAFLRGLARERLIILDAGKLLSDGRLIVDQQV